MTKVLATLIFFDERGSIWHPGKEDKSRMHGC